MSCCVCQVGGIVHRPGRSEHLVCMYRHVADRREMVGDSRRWATIVVRLSATVVGTSPDKRGLGGIHLSTDVDGWQTS